MTPPALSRTADKRLAHAPTLVLSHSMAVSEAIVRSLGLKRAWSGVLGNAADGVADFPIGRPALVIVDHAEVIAILSVARIVQRRWFTARMLASGVPNREGAILRCFRAGVHGVVTDDEPLDHLAQAAQAVLTNALRPPPPILRPRADRLVTVSRANRPLARLSARELEVLTCLARGSRNKEIAQALYVEVQTVKNHVRQIFRKLGVRNRFDAARAAVMHVKGRE